jgi:aryl-alcohol dehydrogenase-like predicted oxidoreductase
VLTGKYRPDVPPPQGTRAGRQDKRMLETEWRPESLHIAQTVAERAAARGVTPGQFAVAWVLANPLITGAIAGPRTMQQWEDYAGALACTITAEDEALIDRLVPPGHPSTAGYNDPAYPLEGRPAS